MTALDDRFMGMALALAARAQGQTRPNPMVGAVVVRHGRVVGIGYHHRAGWPHAEVLALRTAGARARGAVLYVTLEPCRHTGRTPPCVPAIVAAGVRRVVAAMPDPSPRMRGRGLRALRAAGLAVRAGVCRAEAQRLNEVYLTWRRRLRPFVTVKVAQSLDGKIATVTGDSRWITGPAARRVAHALRGSVDAIMVGVRTVLADNPRLTVRKGTLAQASLFRPPLKVVVDSTCRTPTTARLLTGGDPVLIATTTRAPSARRRALAARGAEILVLPSRDGQVDLRALLRALARREITHLLLEGGGELIAAALRDRLVDRWIAFLAPSLIGGRAAPTPVGGAGIRALRQAVPVRVIAWSCVGDDLMVEARIAT
ncbi:MAG: riboflavin biosynthesis protein RibD [Omnitrophica WOR_2 bacterium RIFCSPHIGHO2_02_FULL_68_15]|nr:MAG: riboflavin biosynthesis protein RibD [Omnitrophica WOR_2 bacterium RIFCSPHIGHO2_02_FULL_68_15]